MPFSEQDIADSFCEIIESRGIKRRWIAEQMDVSPAYISSVLCRRMKLTQRFRDNLNRILGTDI